MAEKSLILCDSNILIQLFRKDATVKEQLDSIGSEYIAISIITKAELLAGANKQNYTRTLTILDMFQLIHFNTNASIEFNKLIGNKKVFNANHQIPDALIAATAIANSLPLYTFNRKHFIHIPQLQLYGEP